jgi:phosphatidylethanolamine/phosphatidyl-N-methylethanolamine N-methyltransferase
LKRDFSPSDWYANYYSQINISADPSSIAFRFLHTKIEQACPAGEFREILEVGANSGEHIPFVPKSWDSYVALDLRLPTVEIIKEYDPVGVSFQQGNVESMSFRDDSFDRCISTCVMHHVDSPEAAFREILRVTKINGIMSIAVPNDPGIFYRFLRQITSVRRAKKVDLCEELDLVHALEHKNHFLAIDSILRWVYLDQEIQVSRFPNILKYWQLNFLTVYTVRKIK